MSDEQPVFSIEKIYVKDLSIEVPNAPQIFLERETPGIEVQIQSAAKAIGLDPTLFANRPPGPPDAVAVAFVRPMVEKASLALCVNEAWAMLACVAVAGVLLVPFARDRADTNS